MLSFSVIDFTIDNLINLFHEKTGTPIVQVKEKLHFIFFKSYFQDLHAKTIVVEEKYVDHDYLEDFSYYYVKSFKSYERFCIRIHFFSIEFNKDDLVKALFNENKQISDDILQKEYLGFIVLKPLPQTYIGKTCLKTYAANSNRFFHFIRDYEVNLLGINLIVQSIAFQEQDSIVAACASSAIWSAFQVTGKLFQHYIPTPVEITKSAIERIPNSGRNFPNDGLSEEQMAQAIRSVGLDPYLVRGTKQDLLKATIYAYQKAKIPLIMGMNLIEYNDVTKQRGRHAVTITGYSIAETVSQLKEDNFYLKSSKINKLYVHDDQVGPFARMVFEPTSSALSTSWTDSDGNIGKVKGDPCILIIPLYPKIRIPFEVILRIVYKLNEFINVAITKTDLGKKSIEWDIFLCKSNDYKSEIHKSRTVDKKQKETILLSRMPRYIWRVVATLDGEKIEFVFDSTDIEQGDIYICYLAYSISLLNLFKLVASFIDLEKIKLKPLVKIFEKLQEDKS